MKPVFDLLKQKLANFVSGLTKKEEGHHAEGKSGDTIGEKKESPARAALPAPAASAPLPARAPLPPRVEKSPEKISGDAPAKIRESHPEKTPEKPKLPNPAEQPPAAPAAQPHKPREASPVQPPVQPEKKPAALPPVRLSLESRVKQAILGEVTIQEKDVSGLLEDLEMSLLEADVAYDVAQALVADLRAALVGSKLKRGKTREEITRAVRGALLRQFDAKAAPDLVALARGKAGSGEPLKVLFLGPNGAGKTTTMAKVAALLKGRGLTSVISASDSFRAAAIEQAQVHGERLGVHVVRHAYGADPAAVCFDAINYARAHKIDVVLMDTAGRQETNRNLVEEMKKMARVAKPDLTIFIGESIAGNALVEQVKAFREAVGLDGVILTKLDCDVKGGTALSVARGAGVPILFFGVGQGYADLEAFDAEKLVGALIPG